MHQSSKSVAGLATALAKAQTELINPEKSLIANIRSERRGESNQSFRYAPLASGLDVVRKTLGKHELAVVQTTAVDQAAGMVNLTTLLAHSSGEWISSDWPVCQVADIAVPHRMGAALTYARRYSLFALVGIAGEDDLDAPDLSTQAGMSRSSATKSGVGPEHAAQPNVNSIGSSDMRAGYDKRPGPNGQRAMLAPDQSAVQREQLISKISELASRDEATQWARNALPIKNQLTTGDAGLVEQAFASRIAALSEGDQTGVGPAAGAIDCPVTAEPAVLVQSQPVAPAVHESYAGDWVTRLIRRRGELAFQ